MYIYKMVLRYLIFVSSFAIIILPGCNSSTDTCNQGDNMVNPRLVNGLEVTDSGHIVRITWDPGTEKGSFLPTAYFEAVRIEDKQGIVESVKLTNNYEITVKFRELASYLQREKVLDLSLVFPDRRQYIDCRHPGMSDIYYLSMSLYFTDEGALDTVTFKQSVSLGPV